MLKQYIKKIIEKNDLTFQESQEAMDIIMRGDATQSQIGSFISIMRMKGETVEEISGFADVMRKNAVNIKAPEGRPVIDTCGTGGDGANTFNISTISAFVVSGADVVVAKHGNRAISSKCGSADLLRSIGVNLEVTPEKVEECLDKVGIGFLFAPKMHPAMKHAIGPRRELGIRTFFNVLGPLTNPARVDRQVIGLFSADLVENIAGVLKKMGAKRAMVFNGDDGLDELSTCADNTVSELLEDGTINNYKLNSEDLGFTKANISDLAGGDENDNVEITKSILNGTPGPKTDIVLLNAGAAIYISGIANSMQEGIAKARLSIASGAAKKKLEGLIEMTK